MNSQAPPARPYVVYWNNIPSPYMVERFNAVADRSNIDFEAWFNDRIEPDRSWTVDESKWRFRYRYTPTLKVGAYRLHFPLPVLGRRRPEILVSLYAEPAFLAGWALAKLRGVRTAFWCEVTFDRWIQRRWWKEAIKKFIFPRVSATLGGGENSRAFAMHYGTPPERALCLAHTIDVGHYAKGRENAWSTRDKLKEELGLKGVVFIYVGRLWWGKGIKYLLDAFHKVELCSSNEVSLLLVGDGPEEAALRRQCKGQGIRSVVFGGFKQKTELPRYYAIADVFVFPTLGDPYGLVVDEAMACCLPVISTSSAGEILDRIDDGANGFIVPPEDTATLAERMLTLAQDPGLRKRMGELSARKIAGHTPELWAENFERIVFQLMLRR